MGDGVGEEGRAAAACHRGFGEGARREARGRGRRGGSVAFLDPPFLVVAAHVVDNGSGLLLAGFPVLCRSPWHLRHQGRFGPDGQLRGEMSRSSSLFAVACARLVLLVGYAVSFGGCRPRCSASWPACTRRTSTILVGFAGDDAPRAVFSFLAVRPQIRHLGRYGPEGQSCGVSSWSSTSLSGCKGFLPWSRLFCGPWRFLNCSCTRWSMLLVMAQRLLPMVRTVIMN